MTTPDWTSDNIDQAYAEGWNIFEASGSSLNEDGEMPYQLQRDDEAAIFEDDTTAWHHVYNRANEGSELHRQALAFLQEFSTPEYEAIIKECA